MKRALAILLPALCAYVWCALMLMDAAHSYACTAAAAMFAAERWG